MISLFLQADDSHQQKLCFSVWFVVRYMPYWDLTYFVIVDALAHIIKHFFKLVALNLPKIKPRNVGKILFFVKFLQTFVLLLYTLDALTWNNCNFSFAFCWWLVVQCFFLFVYMQSKCQSSNPKKVRTVGGCSIGNSSFCF